MKKNLRFSCFLSILSLGVFMTACSNDDKLSDTSVLPNEQTEMSPLDNYLYATFTKPFNITVDYEWDRNKYGTTRDNTRNLYPPKYENVGPAMEMVDHVWIQSYVETAGKQFVDSIRPLKFLLAGGFALNDDGTRTLGLASGGVEVTLYEVDYLKKDVSFAKEFIHTIQHEYIHIINQKHEFDEPVFGKPTLSLYTAQWYEKPDYEAYFAKYMTEAEYDATDNKELSNMLGFVSDYARSNIFEDFAETASYLLTNTPEEYDLLISNLKSKDFTFSAAEHIEYKVAKVKEYFKQYFDLDFDLLIVKANEKAASSPLLNGGTQGIRNGNATFGKKEINSLAGKKGSYIRYCQAFADLNESK